MIPDYQSLMRPLLELSERGETSVKEAIATLADEIGLSDEERKKTLPSGKQTVFYNRVTWARTYLKQAGLLENTRRGHFKITESGTLALAEAPERITAKYLERYDAFLEFRERKRTGDDNGSPKMDRPDEHEEETPHEELISAHKRIDAGLAEDLISAVRGASPAFFEAMLVDLLVAMGYGGATEDAGEALGQSGDRGVDGVINQDPLGVDQIYIQAKRYADGNVVGAGDIRDFFGALNIRRAVKGIFFTTSRFTREAVKTADDLGSRIVLIDGDRLASLMIRYEIGCETRDVLKLREIDGSYFDEDAL